MKKLLIASLIGVTLLGFSGFAFAMVGTSLPIGGFVLAGAANNLSGVTQIDYRISPYAHGTVSGTLEAWVYQDTDLNLIFAYQLNNSSTSEDGISRVTSTSFQGYTTEVGYDNSVGSAVPGYFDRGSTFTVGAQFYYPPSVPRIGAGLSSNKWWIKTNSTVYVLGEASIQNGGSENVRTFAPNAIPEPTTMLLLGMGALGLFGLRKRKVA